MRILSFWKDLSTVEKVIHLIPVVLISLLGMFFVYGDFGDSGYIASYTGNAYYVDSASGDDTNLGTRNAPWKTLAKASTATLSSGDALLLKCGERWREGVTFPTQFASSGNVLIAGYGDCSTAYPVVSGATLVTSTSSSWLPVATSSPMYSFSIDLSSPPEALFVDDKEMRIARYPNFTDYQHEFLYMASVPNNASTTEFIVSDAERAYLSTHDPTGSDVYIRAVIYRSDKKTVVSYDPVLGKITLDSPTIGPLKATDGYLFESAAWTLDEKNEWYYDTLQKKLFVYFDPALYPDPNLAKVEMVTRGDLMVTPFVPDVRVEHVAFEKGTNDGLKLVGPSAVASDIKADYLYNSGIHIGGYASSTTVRNAKISYAQQRGVLIESDGSKVLDSTVLNTGQGTHAGGTLSGISFENQVNGHFTAKNNLVSSSSYIGIGFSGDGDDIERNVIQNICLRLSDCGALYSWNSDGNGGPNKTNQSPSLIAENIIENVKSVSYGSDDGGFAVGVYFDDFTGKVRLENNTIIDADTGIFIHNGSDNIIASNTIFGSAAWALGVGQNDYAATTYPIRNNRILGNTIFLPAGYSQGSDGVISEAAGVAMRWSDGISPDSFFTGTNPNILADNTVINIGNKKDLFILPVAGRTSSAYFNQFTGEVLNKRTILPKLFTATSSTSNFISNGDVSTGSVVPWNVYSQDGSSTLGIASSSWCGLSCLFFMTQSAGGILFSNAFTLPSSPAVTPYEISYDAKNATNSAGLAIDLREAGNSYGPRGYNTGFVYLAPQEDFSSDDLFTSSTTDTIRLDFYVGPNSSMYFDNVSLKKVDSFSLTDTNALSRIITNPSTSPRSVTCSDLSFQSCDLVYDETGYPVEFPVSILPYRSKIFIEEISSLRDISKSNFLPSTPAILSLVPGVDTVRASWNTPNLGDATSSAYSLEYRRQGDASWRVQRIAENSTVGNISGLSQDTPYELRLIAHTKNGNSLPSGIVSTRTSTSVVIGGGGGFYSYGGGSSIPSTPVVIATTTLPSITKPVTVPPLPLQTVQPISSFLWRGVSGDDVLRLKQLLVQEKLLAKLEEGDVYDTKTEAAVKVFQCRYGIVCSGSPAKTGWGIVGTKTKNALNSRITQMISSQNVVAPAAGIFQGELSKGSHNKDVVLLQKILIKQKLLVASKDDWLGLFGAKTEAAVKALQCKYNIVCSGSPETTGWGKVDKGTILLLQNF